ncbi:unnamed protein product [Cunninghamella blakesleeana]
MGEWISTDINTMIPSLSLSSDSSVSSSSSPSSSSSSSSSTSSSSHSLLNNYHLNTASLLQKRQVCINFTRFFGMLFEITSLYLESNLDGTFEECVREALVSGNVEGLLLLCISSDKPIDIDGMCLSVSQAGEQLWHYLDNWTHNPTPEQLARQQQNDPFNHHPLHGDDDLHHFNQHLNDPNHLNSNDPQHGHLIPQELITPPEWLIPDRYKIHPNTKLRLKMLNHLYEIGWNWLFKRDRPLK